MKFNNFISISEANQNFSKVTRTVEKNGKAIILKNNKPKFLISSLDQYPLLELTEDEQLEIIAKRILKKYDYAFKVLAQWCDLTKKK